MPKSRSLLRAHALLTARTFQNVIDYIDFGDFVGVCQPDAADFALSQQVIGRVAADAQHGLQILDRYNIRILRKHELVHFSDFFTIHSITILVSAFRLRLQAKYTYKILRSRANVNRSHKKFIFRFFTCAFMLWCATIEKIYWRAFFHGSRSKNQTSTTS